MITLNSKIDLVASFEKLKEALNEAEKGKKEHGEYGYPYAYGYLQSAIKSHLTRCTNINPLVEKENVPAADPNDLKDIKPKNKQS